ncbi:DUF1168-domain-containing protein [Camillea tinctor]|nr:DUF1168-domain-containing protein [Camillea tinctor]
MSGEGPESIPTSADPRSKRPTKKRALSPTSLQASTLQTLFAKPDQPIRIPDPSSTNRRAHARAPPEIVTNVQGSSAGAGSGEFHVYKASRRREYERLRTMDEEVTRERADAAFEQGRTERERRDDERTRRNREKRDKKKKAKERAKVTGNGSKDGVKSVANGGDNDNNKSGNGGNGTPTKGGIKARIDLKKKDDDDEDNNQETPNGKGEPGQDTNDKPVEEPKGIVIEED